ncbi:MAG: response regulator, partial [Bacillota bacterium]|nr:response regulator [Bacillota bacterium]
MKKESFKIIIKEQAGLMRIRIKDMLKHLGLDIMECTTDNVLFNEIKENKELLCCIIIHIDEIENYDIINKIKSKENKAPIIVLTTNKKRNFHIKGIQLGVSDLILIPFKDSTLY